MTKKTNEGGVDGVSGERVRIVRLEIRDFLGIESADVAVPPAGIVVAGASGAGKSSFLKAVSASLLGEACKPEMIRLNRDGSKLHVEVSDGLTITRTLSRLRQQVATLSVKGADGKTVGKAQQAINERFGSSGWDVISFAAAKPKERLELLAAAMPCPVTVEWLRRWVPRLPDTFDVSGHGLAVIDRLASPGGRLYEQRTIAGRDAETAQTQAKMLVEKARALRAIASDDAATVADADRALADRVRAHERLVEARDVAIAHETKIASTREQIASARERAAAIRADMEDDQKLSVESHSAEQQVVASTRLVERLEAELASARVSLERMRAHAKSVSDRVARSMEQVDSIHALEDQAKALESALTAAAPPGASDEQIAAAASAVSAAEAGLASARTLAETLAAEDDARDALARQKAAAAEHERLEKIIVALQTEARTQLLKENNAIPGMEIRGDSLWFDGIAFDTLSSSEQLRVSLEIWKRANTSAVLVIDGLERVSPGQRTAFLAEAVRGGRQVFVSLVEDGDRVVYGVEEDGSHSKPIKSDPLTENVR